MKWCERCLRGFSDWLDMEWEDRKDSNDFYVFYLGDGVFSGVFYKG